MVAYIFAFIDRHVLNLLIEPIKAAYHLSDTQVSLVQGFAFGLFLSLAALPIGRLVDTRKRTRVLATGIGVWSLAAAACGLAVSFPAFVTARIMVSAGEATMTPTAMSLIGDRFPPERMGIATAIYALGLHIGSGLALLLGAFAISHLSALQIALPWGRALHGWQLVFVALGLPGLLVAAWAASLREPTRGAYAAAPLPPVSLRDSIDFLVGKGRAMILINLAVAFALMASYGIAAWLPSFFIRHHGWSAVMVGQAYGPAVIVSGVVGVLLAGFGGDALVRRGVADGRLKIMAAGALIAAPFAALAPLLEAPGLGLIAFAAANLAVAVAAGSGPALLQEIAPAHMRGVSHAVALLTVNVLALGLGPSVVALVTDHVIGNELLVGRSLAVVPPIMLVVASVIALCARAPLRRYRQTAARL
ncbi:MAG: MFS transporter [Sphingomonas sp.]|uniref:MFS transporter n=1 Tax=Sphingomonas sp. TaxID=28214 RepID=UPI001AD23D1A|nr:MFS transporter [Sphingomonas sp.]MBN8816322.1 MFS transporter [Sphingomonas sp.]